MNKIKAKLTHEYLILTHDDLEPHEFVKIKSDNGLIFHELEEDHNAEQAIAVSKLFQKAAEVLA